MSKVSIQRVLLLLVILSAAAVALPFVNYAPNRLVSGEGRQLWTLWPGSVSMLTGAGCAHVDLVLCAGKKGGRVHAGGGATAGDPDVVERRQGGDVSG